MILKIFICIGLPGSGKSTWAEKKVRQTSSKVPKTIIVNKDAIRTMIHGVYCYDYLYENLVKIIRLSMFNTLIRHGYDIIVDETNVSRGKRMELIYHLKSCARLLDRPAPKIIYVWFKERCRNLEFRMKSPRGYSKKTWGKVINDMKNIFEKPLKYEGYDQLIEVKKI